MHFLSAALPLALVSGALASPAAELFRRGACADSCCAQVTGYAAVGDAGIRSSHCVSFLATTVTPKAITATVTVTGTSATTSSSSGAWKRDVTVCPNSAPIYASACTNTAAYSSACSCFGITTETTTTLAPTTTTKTVYVVPTGTGSCSVSTKTVYVGSSSTWTNSVSTVTVTASTCGKTSTTTTSKASTTSSHFSSTSSSKYGGPTNVPGVPPSCVPDNSGFCLTKDQATTIVNDFINFLEFTGANFNYSLANAVLASDFTDQSDSINYLIEQQFNSSYPALGSLTFPSLAAFTSNTTGQAAQNPVFSVSTLDLWYDCTHISWRWALTLFQGATPIQGINMMVINDQGQLETNYSEFNSALWLYYAKLQASQAGKKRSTLQAH